MFKKWRFKCLKTHNFLQEISHADLYLFLSFSYESPWKTHHRDRKYAKIVQCAITSSFGLFGAVQIAQWPKTKIVQTNKLKIL